MTLSEFPLSAFPIQISLLSFERPGSGHESCRLKYIICLFSSFRLSVGVFFASKDSRTASHNYFISYSIHPLIAITWTLCTSQYGCFLSKPSYQQFYYNANELKSATAFLRKQERIIFLYTFLKITSRLINTFKIDPLSKLLILKV